MEKNNLTEKIAGLYSKKSSNFSTEEGIIHPIYEALTALLKEQVSDEEAKKRLIEEGQRGIKSVIIADGFLEMITQANSRNDIKNMLNSGRPLAEIIDRAALYIADDKRTKDGLVLIRSDSEKTDTCFRKALKKANPNLLYLEREELQKIKDRGEKMKKNRPAKIFATIALALVIAFAGNTYKNSLKKYDLNFSHYNSLKTQIPVLEKDIKNKQNTLGNLQTEVYTTEQNLHRATEAYKNKIGEVSVLEKNIETKNYELGDLTRKAAYQRANFEGLEKTIKEKNEEIYKIDSNINTKKAELKEIEDNITNTKQEKERLYQQSLEGLSKSKR
ncbi:MAG: hypothetical protein PHH54_00895 [Candidatus Nanoarchaeia archaeon]|nr:hypothetical protein [Candidatus Nanoarchaeia archaeon]MDD5740520.1 hypothetical protein [Candidatus Nanoarchaeia archaeon]